MRDPDELCRAELGLTGYSLSIVNLTLEGENRNKTGQKKQQSGTPGRVGPSERCLPRRHGSHVATDLTFAEAPARTVLPFKSSDGRSLCRQSPSDQQTVSSETFKSAIPELE
ncbi:hypothetical protein E4U28_000421 [Claviceps purpurea]|nr:hypothetical protein E4U28_000421 [Claviceps purpurea]